MNKISCNVTRDLFAVYMDEICSEESERLVEEHLQECEACRRLLEQMKETDTKESSQNEQIRFFEKAKKYIDNRFRLVFVIALLLIGAMGIYSYHYYSYVPDVFVFVAMPMLMCTFILAQPVKQCTEKKYQMLQWTSVLTGVLLISLQCFVIWQLDILFYSPNDMRLFSFFTWEPGYIGPFLEKVYCGFIIVEIILLVLYYILGKKKQFSFVVAQNAAWYVIGLGVMFVDTLYRMDTIDGYKQANSRYFAILTVEFIVALLFNVIYVRRKR